MYACFVTNISWWDLLNDLVLCMCQCLTRSNLFLFLSAQYFANISEWVLVNGPVLQMCECSTRSYLFLSLSACSIANIRRWVLLNCLVLRMCMWIFDQKYNLFLSCLLVSLPTLAGEFYWMILCCVCVYVWPEVTCFSLCLLTLMLASASEFIEWFCVYVCIFDQK